jgi:metal-responsive CopG/Arc/MetJ family transcriptional regulator
MGKSVLSFRLERKALELLDSKNRNRSSVIREAINYALNGGISKADILEVTMSIPIDEKRRVSLKVDEETLDKLKRIAEEHGLQVSELVRIAIWKFLLEEGVVSSLEPR